MNRNSWIFFPRNPRRKLEPSTHPANPPIPLRKFRNLPQEGPGFSLSIAPGAGSGFATPSPALDPTVRDAGSGPETVKQNEFKRLMAIERIKVFCYNYAPKA
jgi:hypothetical protein